MPRPAVRCLQWSSFFALAVDAHPVYADSFDLLFDPVEDIVDEHEHCGWANPIDLTIKASTSSPFEEVIEIREDDCGNRVLMMGGFLQCHSVDEHIYHEMMIHPALSVFLLQSGRAPEKIFLGGSGDGAGPREVLRWRSVLNATMVDMDYEVTRFASEWMPQLANGSFQDPRLHLVTGDAMQYLQELPKDHTFDVIILDFPDVADSRALEKLYSVDFYRLCREHMHEKSVLVAQTGPCTHMNRAGFRASCNMLEHFILPSIVKVFQEVDVLLHPMATWKVDRSISSEWSSFTMARLAEFEPLDVSQESWRKHIDGELRYYSGARHVAALHHPRPMVNRLLTLRGKAPLPGTSPLRQAAAEL